MQKLLTFFQQKISAYLRITQLNFNESLTNDVVSFEQLGPGFGISYGQISSMFDRVICLPDDSGRVLLFHFL